MKNKVKAQHPTLAERLRYAAVGHTSDPERIPFKWVWLIREAADRIEELEIRAAEGTRLAMKARELIEESAVFETRLSDGQPR